MENQHRVPLNFSVKQIFKVLHQVELVKLIHQTKGLDERLIPELEEERIMTSCLAVNIVRAFTRLRQRVCGLHSFTIYSRRLVVEVNTTKMGEPFVNIATVIVIQSTLVSRLPRLPLSLLSRLWNLLILSSYRPFDFRNEGVIQMISSLVLPPAINYNQLLLIFTDYCSLQSYTCQRYSPCKRGQFSCPNLLSEQHHRRENSCGNIPRQPEAPCCSS